jgi:hypothetical protein
MFYKPQDFGGQFPRPQRPLYEMGIKLESLCPLRGPKQIQSAGPAPYRAASNLNLNIQSFIYFKKKKKLLLTILSGPHVHKKSREQYKIDHFGAYFKINVPFCPSGSDPLANYEGPTLTNEQKNNGSLWFGNQRTQTEQLLVFQAKMRRFGSQIQTRAVRMTFIHSRRDLVQGFLPNLFVSFQKRGVA